MSGCAREWAVVARGMARVNQKFSAIFTCRSGLPSKKCGISLVIATLRLATAARTTTATPKRCPVLVKHGRGVDAAAGETTH